MTELLPCPFCGATDGIGYGYQKSLSMSLCCSQCGVGFIMDHGKGGMPETKMQLAAAWNTRTPTTCDVCVPKVK